MRGAAVAVGVFDGVHLGHQKIISILLEVARTLDLTPVILTFRPHPRPAAVAREGGLLLSEEERAYYLRKMGADWVVYLNFTESIRDMSPESFFDTVLLRELAAKALVVGPTHHFGRDGRGGPELLLELARDAGIHAQVAEHVLVDGRPVSSRRIRDLLVHGHVETAFSLLGRPFRISGVVVPGRGAGGHLVGYPTANVDPSPPWKLIPANGVYGGVAHIEGKTFPAALNIGFAPTVSMPQHDAHPRIEAHVMDWTGDLYGKTLSIDFLARLRDEMKFSDVGELRRQIERDAGRVRDLVEKADIGQLENGSTPGRSDPSPVR